DRRGSEGQAAGRRPVLRRPAGNVRGPVRSHVAHLDAHRGRVGRGARSAREGGNGATHEALAVTWRRSSSSVPVRTALFVREMVESLTQRHDGQPVHLLAPKTKRKCYRS